MVYYYFVMKDESLEILNSININLDISKNIKKCSKCKQIYPADPKFFYRHSNRKDGLDPWCKECKKDYDKIRHKMKKFNISLKQYQKMDKEQNGRCLICGREFNDIYRSLKHNHIYYTPRIDHDHKTGKVRGILCHHCNIALGSFNENPLILVRAIKYLKENKMLNPN